MRHLARHSAFGYWYVIDTQDGAPLGTVLSRHTNEEEAKRYAAALEDGSYWTLKR